MTLLAATHTDLNVAVRMRDGVRLSANVFRPEGNGRVPAILLRTPYDKSGVPAELPVLRVNHGYAVVVEDVRDAINPAAHSSRSIRRSTTATTR